MKILLSVIILFLSTSIGISQNAVFLHHSTGANVYSEGDVSGFINNYNTENGTDIQITERSYPNTPYPWQNYPYDYWNLWINNECNNNSSGIECLESLAASFDIIIWKHCFPGAGIKDGGAEGNINSSNKTIANYKLQYQALRDKMDELPNTHFIVWTLAPLHRLATNEEDAARAGEFVDWVKNQWLYEDSNDHLNIHIFDFFGIVAQTEENPDHGFQYSMKYDFERSHENSDSHPNTVANETAGPLFAQFIIDVAMDIPLNTGVYDFHIEEPKAFPNPTSGPIYLKRNIPTQSKIIIYNNFGQKVFEKNNNITELNISELLPGLYYLKVDNNVFKVIKK
ncbi:T9SS type A sorting domain-containing protein [uncultured Draconibacterium sp.]|uniref:T9SS type A sorting domain-containing protein n=1 Tax=uncultured Draconibacterium sp. TaxID=1573823 RepID=UPI002AA853D3|nr:T9SS type A sorting domain-containing protein [uncultured Draconibacterium sp.]